MKVGDLVKRGSPWCFGAEGPYGIIVKLSIPQHMQKIFVYVCVNNQIERWYEHDYEVINE